MNDEASLRYISKILKSQFGRSLGVLISGTALAQLLPVAVMPVVSRLFTPSDFGVLGLFTAFISVASVAVGLSFPLAIVSDIDERESARIAVLALFSVIPVSAILVLGLVLLRAASVLGYEALTPAEIGMASIALVAIGVFVTCRYWQIRDERFGKISRATISQSAGRVLGQIGSGLIGLGGTGLVSAEVLGRLFGVTALARPSLRRIGALVAGTTRQEYWQTAVEFRKFPLISMPSAVLNSMGAALLVPLLTASYGLSISGQFSMGYRALTLPLAVISAAVADIFHVQLVKASRRGISHARRLFLQVAGALLLLGILPSMVVVFWGEMIFQVALGHQWAEAGAIAGGLMPWLLASFAVSPVSRVVMVFRGQEMKLVYDILNIVGVVGVIWLGSHLDWPILQTARTLGLTQAFAYFVYFLLLWRILSLQKDTGKEANS